MSIFYYEDELSKIHDIMLCLTVSRHMYISVLLKNMRETYAKDEYLSFLYNTATLFRDQFYEY